MVAGDKEMDGAACWAGWIWFWSGEESGDILAREERSEAEDWIECNCWWVIQVRC